MEQSILKSTKKVLHIGPDDESFDLDIMTHINAAFSTLFDLGVGPTGGFFIEDDTAEWADFIEDDAVQLNRVKTFVLMSVRLSFDPPQITHVLNALVSQLEQLTWRISVHREGTEWQDPTPSIPNIEDLELDGGAA